MQQYIRFDQNYGKYILIPVSDSPRKYVKNPNIPHFISMMKYNQDQYEQWKKTKSLAGMHGGTTNRIWADFDSKDLKQAFQDCKTFVERLFKLGFSEDEIQISFSGNKGTGVIVETTNEYTIEQVKTLCTKLSEGLTTFDPSMYDHQRIFRLLFTKNEKTGLYKVPLTFEELDTDPNEIKELAKSLDNFDIEVTESYYKRSSVKVPEELIKVVQPAKAEKKTTKVSNENKPKHWKEYKWQILQGNFEIGERHNALMVLAATCRGLGYDEVSATALCEAADKKHCERTGDNPVSDLETNIITSVYSDSWNGGQYSPETNPWLKKYCERLGIDVNAEKNEIFKIGDVKKDFSEFVKHIDENTVKTGIARLDEAMPLTTGMICGLVAAASAGKTAIALKMLKNTSKAGVTSVFASLDMHRTRLFEKLLYSETGLTRKQLYEEVKQGRGDQHYKKIEDDFSNVYFYDRSSASVHNIRKYIEQIQETTGKKVKFLMIDYFERLGAERSDDTAASKEVAGALQDLCNDMNLCIVVLVQPNKFSLGGGPDSPIMSYTAIKGSSFLYQSFRSIISIWRPFFTPEHKENDRFMQMAILKNDLGELDLFNFGWSGKLGDIWDLTEEGEEELKSLLDQKKQDKEDKKGGSSGWD